MAVEDTLSDMRREQANYTNEIVKEGMKGDFTTQKAITDNLAQTSNQIDAFEDVTNANFMTIARDTQDIRAQIIAQQQQVVAGFAAAAKDSEINGLKTQVELAKQSTYLSDKIDNQAERTRELISRQREDDYGRRLIERNTELVAALDDGRHWRRHSDQGQWAALSSQLQAFQSQLNDTRNSMVNFGTQVGVGQRATSNNVN